MRTQLALERSLTTIAESTGRPSILVYDRGAHAVLHGVLGSS